MFLHRWLTRLGERFEPQDRMAWERRMEWARIASAVLVFLSWTEYREAFRLTPLPELTYWIQSAGMALCACLALGLAVPLVSALLLVLFHNLLTPFTLWSLDNISNSFLLWLFLLHGAGRTLSVDAWIGRRRWGRRYFAALYPTEQKASIGLSCGLMVLLFWGATLPAACRHLIDPYWQRGEALPLIFTAPFVNFLHGTFDAWSEKFPLAFGLAVNAGGAVTLLWELTLFPLALFSWGRRAALWVGGTFFFTGWLVLGLDYYPWYCLILGSLVLYGKRGGAVPQRAPWPRLQKLHVALSLTGFALFFPDNTLTSLRADPVALSERWRTLALLSGQVRVEVFNTIDIQGPALSVTLHRLSDDGTRSWVPFATPEGARDTYLFNDLVYLHSYAWFQGVPESQLRGEEISAPTRRFLTGIAELDQCFRRDFSPTKYEFTFYRREPVRRSFYRVWGTPTPIHQATLTLSRPAPPWAPLCGAPSPIGEVQARSVRRLARALGLRASG